MTIFTNGGTIAIKVDLTQDKDFLKARLYNWLYDNQENTFWGISMHERGVEGVTITKDTIRFSGDDGIYTFEALKIETI